MQSEHEEYTSIGVRKSVKERLERKKPRDLSWSGYLEGLARWGRR